MVPIGVSQPAILGSITSAVGPRPPTRAAVTTTRVVTIREGPITGPMDKLGDVVGKATNAGAGESREGQITDAVSDLLGSDGSGLGSVLDKLKAGGLGDVAGSRVGTGENKKVSGDQLSSALGEDAISGVATKLELPQRAAASALAAALPKIVDALTPDGSIPDTGALTERFGSLFKKQGARLERSGSGSARTRDDAMRVLAVIPAYDEAARVGAVVRDASRYLPVLVVDDGSTDETAPAARAAGAVVLTQKPNQGKGAALKAGFEWALEEEMDAVVTLDADGQHDPGEIPRFLQVRAARDVDLVIGARDYRRMPPQRRLSNTLSRWIISWAVGRPVPDNQSGYRLLSRRLMEAVRASPEQGFAFEVEMIALSAHLGYSVEWVPIRTIYAGQASHIRVWTHVRGFLRVAFRARRVARGGTG